MRRSLSATLARLATAALLTTTGVVAFGGVASAVPQCGPGDLDCELPVPDQTQGPLSAEFTWSMPARAGLVWDAWDEAGAVTDPKSSGYAQSYVDPGGFRVRLSACGTGGGGGRVVGHHWRVTGHDGTVTDGSGGCALAIRVPEGSYEVTHTVRNSQRESDTYRETIAVVDHLIVSLGDSNASGEGNPDDIDWGPTDELDWMDDRCHRSATSGPALAAAALEADDPHSSVTFLSFACSGAEITAGLVEEYAGIEPPTRIVDHPRGYEVVNYLPPQVAAAEQAVCGGGQASCGRDVDALLISIGVNDLGFADLVTECAKPGPTYQCHLERSITTDLGYAFAALPGGYDDLAAALAAGPLADAPVYLTEYPADPFDSHDGCGALFGVSDGEARWLAEEGAYLNQIIRSAALEHGWLAVGGIAQAFDGHGYCADEEWFRALSESYVAQNNIDGSLHPNYAGHEATAAAIVDAFENGEPLDPTPTHRATVRFERFRITDPEAPNAVAYDLRVHFQVGAVHVDDGAWAGWDLDEAALPGTGESSVPVGEWVNLPAAPYTLTVELADWQSLRLLSTTTLPPAPFEPPEACEHADKNLPGCYSTNTVRPLSIESYHEPGHGWEEGTHEVTFPLRRLAEQHGRAMLEVRYTVSVAPIPRFEAPTLEQRPNRALVNEGSVARRPAGVVRHPR
ncbi:MAG: GDSL-type esterase/lipase family protein [Pseudonocardia sp.]|nr:GDSL-type esterase/lipase family protein [Pseudonocardia sp.]